MSFLNNDKIKQFTSDPIKTVKNAVIGWWQKDVLGVQDPPPTQRIVTTIIELSATIGIMCFLESGSSLFEKLTLENTKK